MNKKKVILCADDFGLHAGVCKAIIKLIQLERLTAVSCMVNMPDLKQYAHELILYRNQIDMGLHLNLTEGNWVSKPEKKGASLFRLLMRSHLKLLDTRLIKTEINAQLDRFIELMGQLPHFIDGHQHVHQFPQIRQVLLEVYEERLRKDAVYFRSTYPSLSLSAFRVKHWILANTGGKAFADILAHKNLEHNETFAGVYDFDPNKDYAQLFRLWLSLIKNNTLIMCHPSTHTDTVDPILKARIAELSYLASESFIKDCADFHVDLGRRQAQR